MHRGQALRGLFFYIKRKFIGLETEMNFIPAPLLHFISLTYNEYIQAVYMNKQFVRESQK